MDTRLFVQVKSSLAGLRNFLRASVVEAGGGEDRTAAEREAEGIKNKRGKYREHQIAIAGVPGGGLKGYGGVFNNQKREILGG
jgi:hypothetical protein